MVSANYRQEAIDRGWYDPAVRQALHLAGHLRPAAAASTPPAGSGSSTPPSCPEGRPSGPTASSTPTTRIKALNHYFQFVEPLSLYPFSAQAGEEDLGAGHHRVPALHLRRDHLRPHCRAAVAGAATARAATSRARWPRRSRPGTCGRLLSITNRRPVARHRGHYGMVCQLRGWLPDAIGGLYWVYLDNPYFSPYVPIYAGCTTTAPAYQVYDPERYSETSARWAIDFVDNLANLQLPGDRQGRPGHPGSLGGADLRQQAEVEAQAVKLVQRGPPAGGPDYLNAYCVGLQEEVPRMYSPAPGKTDRRVHQQPGVRGPVGNLRRMKRRNGGGANRRRPAGSSSVSS